jgi:membrane protease YdiL (CAAX protease family)
MSEAGSSSATVKSYENIAPASPAILGGWGDGILVLAMVLAPIGLAIILTATIVFAIAGWQALRSVAVELPTKANLQLYGMLSYAVGSWIDVAAVWLWSSRRGLRKDVFIFRRLTWSSVTASVAGFVITLYGAPIMLHWLVHVTGGQGSGVRIDFHDIKSIAAYFVLFVVTTPVSEEILYRGLLVVWLRRVGWRDPVILLVGSLIFGANHVLPLGFAFGAVMVAVGSIWFALRLRYDSLSPAWLSHFLFNAQPFLILPLIIWLAPALHPGYLS